MVNKSYDPHNLLLLAQSFNVSRDIGCMTLIVRFTDSDLWKVISHGIMLGVILTRTGPFGGVCNYICARLWSIVYLINCVILCEYHKIY